MEESIKIEEAIAKALKLEAVDPRTYSPLVLAYIGDAVYELLIRTKVINHGSMQVNKMHKKSASLVKAETQANIIKAIQEDLTEEELAARPMTPVTRDRYVPKSLKAYASMVSSADKGAVRII